MEVGAYAGVPAIDGSIAKLEMRRHRQIGQANVVCTCHGGVGAGIGVSERGNVNRGSALRHHGRSELRGPSLHGSTTNQASTGPVCRVLVTSAVPVRTMFPCLYCIARK